MPIARKLGIPFDRYVIGASLIGPQDGNNKLFSTPDKYLPETLSVFYNGVCMKEGEDYWRRESGGAGTGYNQIEFITRAPLPNDVLQVNYVKA